MAMMAITTNSSINVKALADDLGMALENAPSGPHGFCLAGVARFGLQYAAPWMGQPRGGT
jgi:hypothetical protein